MYLILSQLETQAQRAVLVAMAYDAERAYLGRVADVRPDACAYVIIAHAYNAQCVTCIGRQFAQVHTLWDIVACHEFYRNVMVLRYHLVNASLDLCYLLLGWCAWQGVVALALLSLDMRITATLASEHPYHGLVQDVFYRMHWRD